MTPQRYEQMRTVFMAARELPPEQRDSYLKRTCAGDDDLREEVLELLDNAEVAHSFLEQPAPRSDAGVNVSADAFRARPNGDHAGQAPATTGRTGDGSDHAGGGFLAGYELQTEVHRGGQGIVYKALQRSTNRYVAIKVLPEGPMASDRQKQRFEREVTLAANLRHPNIVTVYDSGLTEGRYYYVMEYVHGQPLNEYVAAKGLRVDEKLRLFSTICSAVAYAHLQNVIHRDLKPGNILVDARGVPHVVDFGLAKTGTFDAGGSGTPITVTSQFMGTLAYASPEQTMGDPSMVDARSDVYSLGVILFEMLTGRLPYPITQDVVATFKTIREREPARPSKLTSDLDLDIDTIVLRALAKESERRYQTAADLSADIERYLAGEAIAARRDSITYVLRKRGTALSRKHRVATSALIVLLATALTELIVLPLLLSVWRAPINAFEKLSMSLPSPAAAGTPYQDLALVALDDESAEQVDEMAQAEGFTDVDIKRYKSLRRLNGRLFERLAGAGIKGLAWDGAPRTPEVYDDDLIKGIKALQAVGIRPVVAVWEWAMDTRREELIAPEIRKTGVAWGCPTMEGDKTLPWKFDLIVHRSESTQLIGFSLAAVAAMKHPDKELTARLDMESGVAVLHFHTPDSEMSQSGLFSVVEHVPLTSVRSITEQKDSDVDVGLAVGDVVGDLMVQLPSDDEIRRFTVPYHHVMSADPTELRALVGGKLVVLGDCRSKPDNTDVYDTPDGRSLPGVIGNVAAIDAILRQAHAARIAGNTGWFAILIFGATVGVLVWIAGRGKLWRTWAMAGLAIALLSAFSILLFRFSGYLQNPLVPAVSMATAIGIAAVLYRSPRKAASVQHTF